MGIAGVAINENDKVANEAQPINDIFFFGQDAYLVSLDQTGNTKVWESKLNSIEFFSLLSSKLITIAIAFAIKKETYYLSLIHI